MPALPDLPEGLPTISVMSSLFLHVVSTSVPCANSRTLDSLGLIASAPSLDGAIHQRIQFFPISFPFCPTFFIVCMGTASTSLCPSTSEVHKLENAPTDYCLTIAWWTNLKLNLIKSRAHHFSFPVSSLMFIKDPKALQSARIVNGNLLK